jgi:hypothetical protein
MNDGMNDGHEARYVVTDLGMRVLAAMAGTPPGTFACHGGVTVPDGDVPYRPVRMIEHTLGVNRFFVRLAEDARQAGWHLAEWRNEAESSHRFRQDDRSYWIRPDGAGVLVVGRESHPFLLEYDRGTLDAGDYRGKFEGYRRYFAACEWDYNFATEPTLLFACADDRAERHVARALAANPGELPVLVTTEWRYQRDRQNHAGLLGPIWRSAQASNGARDSWPVHDGVDDAAPREREKTHEWRE